MPPMIEEAEGVGIYEARLVVDYSKTERTVPIRETDGRLEGQNVAMNASKQYLVPDTWYLVCPTNITPKVKISCYCSKESDSPLCLQVL